MEKNKNKFEELIIRRKIWVDSSKENKFDFDNILAGLYADPSHFIYELLQNAEDEYAKSVEFKLFEEKLDFYHDGKDFDINDVEGVTGIGISKKKEDLNLIGKFGVGFKSVFAITSTPQIFSGEYKFEIENFVIPKPLLGSSDYCNYGTLIRFPFNHKDRSKEEIFTLIRKRLENLELRTLLFLKNIKEIKWETPFSNGHYLKESKSLDGRANIRRETLLSSTTLEEYIVITKPVKIEDKELSVEVAYKIKKDEKGKEKITAEPNSKLVVFFPTEKVTFLNFLIQGPYRTTPNRENIPLNDGQNRLILKETANLIAESLGVIKEIGYLDVNFLNILPINSAINDEIYGEIFNKIKEKLLYEEFLPTSDGKYTKANDALLARGKELTEFLSSKDIEILFSKKAWLDTNITYDKTRGLRDYLVYELKIPEIDFESFARKITKEFLQTKSDEWLIDFYKRLLDQLSLWKENTYSRSSLRTKPIIRLENGEHIAPYDENGKIQVYLPTRGRSPYKTVKSIFVENEESLKFLKQLGLKEPDLYAEIKEFIIPKYQKENPVIDDSYLNDFEKLLRWYENIPSNKKEDYLESISQINFVLAVGNDSSESVKLLKPEQVYFRNEDLEEYFRGYPVYFVSDKLYYGNSGKERVRTFLEELKVENVPRRIRVNSNLSPEDKINLRGNIGCSREISEIDYDLEGLNNFLSSITQDRSYLLWRLLLKGMRKSKEPKSFFLGYYSWSYYREYHTTFEAKFLKTLKNKDWLVDKNGVIKKASEIKFSELSDDYIKEDPNINILKEIFEFKPDILDQLPEEQRKILEITSGWAPEQVKEAMEFYNKLKKTEKTSEHQNGEWTPELCPNDVSPTMEEIKLNEIEFPHLSWQSTIFQVMDQEIRETGADQEKVIKEVFDRKKIGRWGEEYVYNTLWKKLQEVGQISETDLGFKVTEEEIEIEVVWLNKIKDRGVGYDIVIRECGVVREYIEVKTKLTEKDELIEVTGAQFELARKLYESGEGEKYCFFIVENAGNSNAKIKILKNPIKLWKEGKLYAHPVNFKL